MTFCQNKKERDVTLSQQIAGYDTTKKRDEIIVNTTNEEMIGYSGVDLTVHTAVGSCSCKRYKTIKVQYQTLDMQARIKNFTGWTAQIIQHEVDHCNGVLI